MVINRNHPLTIRKSAYNDVVNPSLKRTKYKFKYRNRSSSVIGLMPALSTENPLDAITRELEWLIDSSGFRVIKLAFKIKTQDQYGF